MLTLSRRAPRPLSTGPLTSVMSLEAAAALMCRLGWRTELLQSRARAKVPTELGGEGRHGPLEWTSRRGGRTNLDTLRRPSRLGTERFGLEHRDGASHKQPAGPDAQRPPLLCLCSAQPRSLLGTSPPPGTRQEPLLCLEGPGPPSCLRSLKGTATPGLEVDKPLCPALQSVPSLLSLCP